MNLNLTIGIHYIIPFYLFISAGNKKISAVYIFNLSDMTLKPQTTRNYKRKTKQGRLEDSKGSTFFTHQNAYILTETL